MAYEKIPLEDLEAVLGQQIGSYGRSDSVLRS